MKKLVFTASTLLLASCADHVVRVPSSVGQQKFVDAKVLSDAYQLNMELDQLNDRKNILQRSIPKNNNQENEAYNSAVEEMKVLEQKISDNQAKLLDISDDLVDRANDLQVTSPKATSFNFVKNYRVQNEKLIIQNPENYKTLDGAIVRTYAMDLNNVTSYQLGIVNKAFKPVEKSPVDSIETENETRRHFDAKITCDADFSIKKSFFKHKVSKNKEYTFKIYEQSGDGPKTMLSFDQNINNCALTFVNPEDPKTVYGVKLVNDKLADSKVNSLRNYVDVCLLPENKNLSGVEKFFLTNHYQSMTCAMGIGDIKTLEIPAEGVKSKAEALLGQPLPSAFIEQKDPFLDLDFSKAPKLKSILISYLVFREDFYGNLITRLIKWHADHGTEVKILVSDVITLKKDKEMLYNLQESSNNIKIQEFRYDSQKGQGLWDHLSEFHRTMHVKLLITLSDVPENNVVFFGGRNIHDGFVFKEVPDHSKYPQMVQYGSGKGKDEAYTHWRDFEMRIKSKDLAERVAAHLQTLWEKDSKTMFVRSINHNIVSSNEADKAYFENRSGPLVRHFMSIPYKDEHALENFYAEMLDSAQKSIRISTPYFRPTKIIGDAMERAVKRGVEVSLITRIDLSGDTAAIILGEVNKAGINQFLNKIKIFEYTEPNVILHSKLVLIDGKYSFVGSVNLNKRSFVHDTENGIMVYDQNFNQRMNSIMDTYKTTSREVVEKQKIALWKRAVIGIFDEEF